jgi:hypothetical protein
MDHPKIDHTKIAAILLQSAVAGNEFAINPA